MLKNPTQELQELLKIYRHKTKPLNTTEACEYLGLSKSYLFKLTSQNKLPFFKPNGKLIYFLVSDLDNWILRNKCKADYELEQEAIDYIAFGGKK